MSFSVSYAHAAAAVTRVEENLPWVLACVFHTFSLATLVTNQRLLSSSAIHCSRHDMGVGVGNLPKQPFLCITLLCMPLSLSMVWSRPALGDDDSL